MEQISRRWKDGPSAEINSSAAAGSEPGVSQIARVPEQGLYTFSSLRNTTGPATSSNWFDDRRHLSPTAAISAAAH
jgi:hypothetical protein